MRAKERKIKTKQTKQSKKPQNTQNNPKPELFLTEVLDPLNSSFSNRPVGNVFMQLLFLQGDMSYVEELNFSIYWKLWNFPSLSPAFYLFIFLLKPSSVST